MNILVIGAGYVGLSNAVFIAEKCNVEVIDIDKKKIDLLQKRVSPIKDRLLESYLKKESLKINFEPKISLDLRKFSFVVIATPTNFDPKKNNFDTRSVEGVLKQLKRRSFNNLVVIRSTVPIGFTSKMQKKFNFPIAFFPEFLREGKALKDSLYPSRIICGSNSQKAKRFLNILKDCSKKKNIPTIITSSSEAEAIKLFSNTYLAMRIAFFNEVDSFAISNNLDPKNIIDGISLDSRIGNYYNNPSFGYGGYCLPKDTKQLRSNFIGVPQKLVSATIQSNLLRKKFITEKIVGSKKSKIGIYKLSMKTGSDNFRESAIIDIIKMLKRSKQELVIFEPLLDQDSFLGIRVERSIKDFLEWCDLIIANRIDKKIKRAKNLVFSRDLFNID
tara:strand:+ start:107 stop:1270 length:1164 start_codon:yes stop_codon:yes gene_type:complete